LIALLLSPIGRGLAAGALLLVAVGAIYHAGARSGAQKVERAAQEDAVRRLKDAINAGDAVPLGPDGLRKPDSNARD
jgi:hypothetical protein